MLNAKEANKRTNNLLAEENEKKDKKHQEFCDTVCQESIEKAIANKKYTTSISIPTEFDTELINAMIQIEGYTTFICHGLKDNITISWKKG